MADIVKRLGYGQSGGSSTAAGISYDNDDSGLLADNVQEAIDEVVVDLSLETSRATLAEAALDARIDNEIVARTTADGVLQDNIDAEVTRATGAESALDTRLDTAETDIDALQAADVALDARLDTAEAEIDQLQLDVVQAQTDADMAQATIDAHIADTTDAHDASAISTVTSGIITATNVQDSFLQAQDQYKYTISSGIITGGAVTINADPTKIDISAGTGRIVDYWTTPGTPIVHDVSWTAKIGVTVTNLATSTLSYIAIDSGANVVQYGEYPSNIDRRDVITLVQLGHTLGTIVQNINPAYTSIYSPMEQLRDLYKSFNLINEGVVVSPNGVNLSINTSAGSLVGLGANYSISTKNPNEVFIASKVAATVQYRTQTGVVEPNTTTLSVGNYDLGGVVTAIPGPASRATNQRVFLFPNGNIRIQYGQTVYTSLSSAIQGIQAESFIIYSNIAQSAVLIGIIAVTKGATDLTDTANARFIPVSKLGETIGGAAGISTTTLQQAYNNSVEPEITTSSINGAVSVRVGSGADTDQALQVQQNSGTTNFSVTGLGVINSTSLTASTVLVSDSSKNVTSSSVLSSELNYLAGSKQQTTFAITNNTASPTNVTNFAFTSRGFIATVSVEIIATSSLYETVVIQGTKKGATWVISYSGTGDDSLVLFDITNGGQITYTCANYAGFVSGNISFRAIITG